MQHKCVIRAGAAGTLGVILCFCGSAQATPAHAKSTGIRASSGKSADLQTQPSGATRMQTTSALGLTTPPHVSPWQQISVHAGDTLSGVFAQAGLGTSQWRALLDLGQSTDALRHIHPGDTLEIRKTATGKLAELRYPLGPIKTLEVSRQSSTQSSTQGSTFQVRIEKRATQTREITATGTVDKSLTDSMIAGGVPARIADQITRIYRYRHNLRHLQPSDHFSVIYQATYSDGEQIAAGPVLAASISTDHHNYKAFRAKDADGNFGYFDTTGASYKPAFSRKPVAYTRISSGFSLHRRNPVTHTVQPHEGVDMAAPMGTPIHAAAEGTVKYAGWMHGYGRLVELTNFDGYSTRYAHMHKIRSKLHVGEHVSEGEVIGYVGATGEATGPHLHFEIRHDGVAHNPLTMKLPTGTSLPRSQLAAYTRKIEPLIAKLSPAPTTLLAKTASTPTNGNNCRRAVSLNASLVLNPAGAAQRHSLSNLFCVVHQPTFASAGRG